ncbi:23S rRNA (uracil(1939)-C(5))-methyltransferase RlmD [Candidatus Woesearchaeota archaeon]|nr:23S rRNA (uracil(1939)-C(5))-methyltransferase RlmD [Candidatus Woesearchaeota archaeon]
MATPLCQYFGSCGGCTAQHIDYAIQVENKKRMLSQVTKFSDITVFSGKEYFYRNRMDFIFQPQGLGLRKKGQWDRIIPIEQCVIAEKAINELMKEIQHSFSNCDAFDVKRHSGTFRYAVIRTTPIDSSISFVLNSGSSKLAESIEKVKDFAKISTVKNILVTRVPANSDVSISSEYFVVKGKDTLETEFLGKEFSHSIQGFFQNNHAMAEKMQMYVKELLEKYDTKNTTLLDLYGGVGTFGITSAERFKEIIVIESVKEAMEQAKKNAEQNNAKNVKTLLLDAKQLSRVEVKTKLFVITDPPRTGMDQKTIATLNQQKPECIIYISCNPEQLGKDLPKLREYEIKSCALFDLFPQTPHSEAIVELIRKKETTKDI